jgi:hypothetical protein
MFMLSIFILSMALDLIYPDAFYSIAAFSLFHSPALLSVAMIPSASSLSIDAPMHSCATRGPRNNSRPIAPHTMYPILDVMTVARFGVCVYQR